MPHPKTFFRIAAFVADGATVDPNGVKTLAANSFSIFFIKDKPAFLLIVLKVYLKIVLVVLF